MNVDNPGNSNSVSSSEVTSKYFKCKGVMDESLSDFQEKKIFTSANCTQKVQKPSTSKPKKKIKRIRGQKDIRTALNKKNELIAYSNDFDKICKKSGIDVDPEQLQLAIALSKSLQQTGTQVEEDSPSSLTTQERTGKIRTTLQEYGFVVPKGNIKSRKLKKHRKYYKLLQTTEAEKQQIVSDKYSQVLFESLSVTKVTNHLDTSIEYTAQLYHIGTSISYAKLKDNTILYIEGLLENSPNFIGCLLKDWTKIPGRPLSPIFELPNIKFERIDFTQEELDIVLSGHLKFAQEIVKNKYSLPLEETIDNVIKTENCVKKDIKKMDDCIEIVDVAHTNTLELSRKETVNVQNKPIEVLDVENSDLLIVQPSIRSCSPDIFDDEVSEIIDSPDKSRHMLPQELSNNNITKTCHNTMDLTECVININSHFGIIKPIPLIKGNDTTKRKLNDFMDMTECVGSSQPIRENINIDLTQNDDDNGNNITISKRATNNNDVQSMDLTQSSDTNEDLPIVQISGRESMDETIILNEDAYSEHHNAVNFLEKKRTEESCDYKTRHRSFTDEHQSHDIIGPITVDSENEIDNHTNIQNKELEGRAISPIECLTTNNNNFEFDNIETHISQNKSVESFDSKQGDSKGKGLSEVNISKSKTESFFEEFVYRHSDSSSKENSDDNDILYVGEVSQNSITNDNDGENKGEEIDLTQETINANEKVNSPKISFHSSGVGKFCDVSIDYDEVYDGMVRSDASSASKSKSISSRSVSNENIDKPSSNDLVSNSSQTCDVFEISDQELDYSMNKSKLDFNPNFEFGGISVMDNLPDLPSFRQSTNNVENNINRSMSDSDLLMVDIKGIGHENVSKTKSCSESPTPCTISSETALVKTPKNGEYIIKTDGVTPMLNYERLTTPERNAELDKYGLKPFKRKRAIQFLTHLYNQTHPVVESLENLPSPSKRFKPSTNTQTSPTKRKSPTKCEVFKSQNKFAKSQREFNDPVEIDEMEVRDKELDIYDVTNEVPDIRDVECSEDDWVFQKREKAKLHTCRVPLHVAFHNYVHARRALRESVLRYEPVDIDRIHKGLVADGFRYDPKELLKFMDKKCITVKTADNYDRNKKH